MAVVIILVCGFVYMTAQQMYRQSANDPQIQIALDVVTAINSGSAAPDSIVSPSPTADMTTSLSPFLVIYSATGTPIGASVFLDGKLPTVPSGVLDYVKEHGEERLTWEPKDGLRIAAIVVKYSGTEEGYVLVGRSLKEVEVRINELTKMSVIATVATLVLSFFAVFFMQKKREPAATVASPIPGHPEIK